MNTKDLIELADEAKKLLITDFQTTNDKNPTQKELLNHIKKLFNEGEEDTILNDLFLDDVDCPSDFHKLLLIFSVFK